MKKLPRSARLSRQLRSEILVVAAQLFREKGFLNTTLSEVAFQTGISKANIYNYFHNKKSLLYEVLSEGVKLATAEGRLIATSAISPKEKFAALVNSHLEMVIEKQGSFGGVSIFERKNLPLRIRKTYDALRDEYEYIFKSVFEELISSGQPLAFDTKLTTRLVIGLINSVQFWFKKSGPLSSRDVADVVYHFIVGGIFERNLLE